MFSFSYLLSLDGRFHSKHEGPTFPPALYQHSRATSTQHLYHFLTTNAIEISRNITMEFQTSLLLSFTAAAYISKKCFRSPNPVPKNRHHKDSLFSHTLVRYTGPKVREYEMVALAVLHIIVTAVYPTLQPSRYCPHPERLNRAYFTWSPYVKVSLAVIFVFGAIRLYTFRVLGKNFTFELAKPNRLITTSIYAYAQHPSYFPDFALSFANIALFASWDGVFACFLPLVILNFWARFRWLIMLLFTLLYWKTIWARIKDEEEMLEDAFGDEWRQWHAKTARLIPGVF